MLPAFLRRYTKRESFRYLEKDLKKNFNKKRKKKKHEKS